MSASQSSSNLCVAADVSGDAPTWSSSTWSSPASVDGTLDSVSCVSASFCVALGVNDVNGIRLEGAVTWNGST